MTNGPAKSSLAPNQSWSISMKDFLKVCVFLKGALLLLTVGVIFNYQVVLNNIALAQPKTSGLVLISLVGIVGVAASIILEFSESRSRDSTIDLRLFLKIGSFLLGAILLLGNVGVFVQQALISNVILDSEQCTGLVLLGIVGIVSIVSSIVMTYND